MIKIAKDNELLKKPTEEFKFDNPQTDPKELAGLLVNHVLHFKAAAVGASQIGLPYSVFALNTDPKLVCFNPKITTTSDELVVLDEMDVSHPGLVMKVKRPKHIRLRFYDPAGTITVEKFTGMTARYALQQMDYINGVGFFKRANRFHKEAAIKKLTKHPNYSTIPIIRQIENSQIDKQSIKELV